MIEEDPDEDETDEEEHEKSEEDNTDEEVQVHPGYTEYVETWNASTCPLSSGKNLVLVCMLAANGAACIGTCAQNTEHGRERVGGLRVVLLTGMMLVLSQVPLMILSLKLTVYSLASVCLCTLACVCTYKFMRITCISKIMIIHMCLYKYMYLYSYLFVQICQ